MPEKFSARPMRYIWECPGGRQRCGFDKQFLAFVRSPSTSAVCLLKTQAEEAIAQRSAVGHVSPARIGREWSGMIRPGVGGRGWEQPGRELQRVTSVGTGPREDDVGSGAG